MIHPLEMAVGLRYTRAKRRNHFISFISLASMLGITLGVMALITVLSVMNGFQKELQTRMLAVTADATITGDNGLLADWRDLNKQVVKDPHVVATAPYVLEQAMLSYSARSSGAIVRGIDPMQEEKVSDLGDKMVSGSMDALTPGSFGIALGRDLAWKLGVHMGSKLAMISPEGLVTPAGAIPRVKRFTVVGIFSSGHYEYDSTLVLVNMTDAARMFRLGDNVGGLRLKLDDVYKAPEISDQIAGQLAQADPVSSYRVRDWSREHANFFRALKMEKRVMFIILLLIVAVAAFNIVSTMVMVVTDKQSEIAILRTLGMSPSSVMGVFMVQGTIIGLVGTLAGAVLGILLALNLQPIVEAIETLFHTHFLDPKLYFITELPSDLRWSDVTTITTSSFLMSIVATIYPAWRASRTHPAEALRYE